MAEGRETRVSYKAIAKFAELHRELRKVRTELAKTQAAEKAFNASSVKSSNATSKALQDSLKIQNKVAKAQDSTTGSISKKTDALRKEAFQLEKNRKANVRFVESVGDVNQSTGEVLDSTKTVTEATSRWGNILDRMRQNLSRFNSETKNSTASQLALARAKERHVDASENLRISELRLAEIMKSGSSTASRIAAAEQRVVRSRRAVANASTNVENALKRMRDEGNRMPTVFRRVEQGGNRLFNSLQKFGNWRPRLVPPFIALIPIIGAVIAAINPLIALMGSLGSVAIGLAGSIGSLSGAFLALPGILSGVVSGIASVIASMGGVGSVFKTYSAMQKATNSGRNAAKGGGSGGETQADRAERLADAERNLARAQRSVQKAQENLNKARQQALEDLIDLRIEVSRAGMDEERAIANLRKAQEEYWNVMADPGSTLGDKLDAAVSIKEAEADLQDVRKKNIANQKELADAEKKGINGSERVIDAQERLSDAYESQRDAQRALRRESQGSSLADSTGAAATAIYDFNDALNQLSPSARKFVLALLAMEDQWKAFKREMQETFFSQFVDDLDRLPRLLNTLGNFLRPSAKAMGQFVSAFMEMLDSPEWSNDLATIGEQNATVISALGDAFLALSGVLKDVIIAAGPFTEWMVTGFAEGAENFRDFVGEARQTGRLAEWLDKVADRMAKWWEVVKNVGATIFNYSAAAEDFGGWLLDGLVKITEGWREASEAAREEGSPFRTYLEDVQPLLSEVKGLFGDFFGWLREEMMDPENIQDAQDLVKIIREDLGPALSGLLDVLADTDIDEKFVKALSSIIESLDTILENGGGAAFETFFDIIEEFFDWLADVTEDLDPDALEAILKFIGGLAAVTFIGKFTGLTSLLGAIVNLSGLKFTGALTFLSRLLKVAGVAGAILSVVGGLIDVASKAGNIFEALNNGDLKGAQQGITDVDDGLLFTDNPLAPVPGTPGYNPLSFLSDAAGSIDAVFGTDFKSRLQTTIDDIFNGAKDSFASWWADTATWWNETVVPGWNGFWEGLGTSWNEFWGGVAAWWDENVGQPLATAWKTVQDAFVYGWTWINQYVITPFRLAWAVLSAWFDETFVQPIKRAWTDFQTALSNGWTWINTYVFTPFKNGFNTLKTTVESIVNGLGTKWNELKEKFRAPIQFVIDTVYNNGIRSFWNGIASKFGWAQLGTVRMATGGVLPGYTPGRDVHNFVSPTGGRLALSGGEAIMRPEFTRAVGGKKGVDALNKKAIRGEAFADGGVFGRSKPGTGGLWEVAGDVWDKFAGLFSNPIKYIKDGINALVSPMLGGIPGRGTDYTGMISKIPGSIVDGLAGFAQNKAKDARRKVDNDLSGGGPAPANVMGWRAQWAAVKAAFPGASLNSAYRPGARTINGGLSYHGSGRAIDVTPSMAIFNWIKQNYPNSRELIYSPAGGRQLQNGRETFWGEPVRGQHWDHVHWAMKHGGVVPGLYDNGGWLPNGGMAVNKSGKPEAVLDPQESRALKALLSGSGLSARPAFGASAATAVQSAMPQSFDNSINIEKVEITNPVPEKMSESLPRSIRKIGYMNEARTR